MSKRKSIFGHSKDEIWGQIATDIGGEFIEGGFWGKDVLIDSAYEDDPQVTLK